MTAQCETSRLTRCLLMHPAEAWRDQAGIDREWRDLGYRGRPVFEQAMREYEAFAGIFLDAGVEVEWMSGGDALTMDAIYVRDAAVVCDRGAILCRMGKDARAGEPTAQGRTFAALGIEVLGRIEEDGRLEGGDVVWLDRQTVAVGVGYRTNEEGARQLGALLGPEVKVIPVHLPHWRGPGDVFHLMSILSPLDRDLALVYSPLMPVTFRDALLARGFRLVEVPDDEVDMGPNAVTLTPRRVVVEASCTGTARRLERAGVEVVTYEGREISLKGLGGPTCLTRPLERAG